MTLRLFVLVFIFLVVKTSYSQSKIESLVKNLPKDYEYQFCSDTSIINREIKDYVEVCWDEHKNLKPLERIQIIKNDTLISTLYFFNNPEKEEKVIRSLNNIQLCNYGFNGRYFKVDDYIVSSIGTVGKGVCLFDQTDRPLKHDHDCIGLRKTIEDYLKKP